jgi:hypothetical protein
MNRRFRVAVVIFLGASLVGLAAFTLILSLLPRSPNPSQADSEPSASHMDHESIPTMADASAVVSIETTKLIAKALDANQNDRLDDEEYAQMVELWNQQAPVPETDGLIIDRDTFLALTEFWLHGTFAPPQADEPATSTFPRATDPLAAQFLKECAAGASKISCYLVRFEKVIYEFGTERALTVLEQVAAEDRAALAAGHPLAHEIGRLSFSHYEDAATAFGHCREMFDSGCYHGVLEAVLTSTPDITPQAVGGLCEAAVSTGSSSFVKFQCVHGLGHGLLMHFHEIPEALSYCDALPTTWDQESCYGGVFMEHIVAVNTTNPHHTHPHQLDPNDHLAPCNQVEKKYQGACYLLQSSAILMLNGYDFAQGFRTCERAPAEFIAICYQSMGRDVSGFTLRDGARSYALCLLGSPPYVDQCIIGVAKDYVNNSANADPGLAFCRRVGAEHKRACYRAVGQMVSTIYPDVLWRQQACAKAEEGYQGVCEAAAGVPR